MTIADWGSVAIAAVVLINAFMRVAKGSPNHRLLWASLTMIIPLLGSISIVFDWADPLLGGGSYVNLITHLIMIFSEWSVTRATEDTLQAITPKARRPWVLRPWVPLVAVAGTIVSFLWLNPGSSRGLAEYGSHPAYLAYWAFTILPIILPAVHLVPRMWKGRELVGIPPLVRGSLGLLMLSYAGSLVILGAFLAAAIFPELVVVRDSLSTVVLSLFALSLLVATAALPPAGERVRQPAPRLWSPTPHQQHRGVLDRPATR
jgi:hypothetical protein